MKFSRTDSDENFDILRCVSETGKWEFGIRRMLFGVRVCGNPVGEFCYAFDYCAASNQVFALELLVTVARILERYPESATTRQIQDDFPRYEIKPIDRDPLCWKQLQEMADGTPIPEETP